MDVSIGQLAWNLINLLSTPQLLLSYWLEKFVCIHHIMTVVKYQPPNKVITCLYLHMPCCLFPSAILSVCLIIASLQAEEQRFAPKSTMVDSIVFDNLSNERLLAKFASKINTSWTMKNSNFTCISRALMCKTKFITFFCNSRALTLMCKTIWLCFCNPYASIYLALKNPWWKKVLYLEHYQFEKIK